MNVPCGDPTDFYIWMVTLALRDARKGNKQAVTAREFLMDDVWVAVLDVSPETAKRIRESIPA